MCGIAGVYNLDGAPVEAGVVSRLRGALAHRGPDDQGELLEGPLGLGFARLSILDLEGGHQPMASADGSLVIVFNGEIYNHPELRVELAACGARFRTRADTETILELWARLGPAALDRLRGMFAFAIWDRRRRELVLARDPVGIKPLFYSLNPRRLAFASELRALLGAGFGGRLDPAGVLDYLAFGKVHAPRTVVAGVRKLKPGYFLRVSVAGTRLERFWSPPRRTPESLSRHEAEDRLDAVLSDAVRGNLLSDVPVGAFLSGGVDSSLVAALMVRHAGGRRVKTFSVGFTDAPAGVDETPHARRVARELGTDHSELMLPARVLSRWDEAAGLLDEPLGDSAILPTFLLSRYARTAVKVVLTGEGGDELFGGYGRYKAAWLNELIERLPAAARGGAAVIARRLGHGRVFAGLPFRGARDWAMATLHTPHAQVTPLFSRGFPASEAESLEWLRALGPVETLNDALAFDLQTELADGLLMKVDKSTMRASLEARVPLLDRAVVEFAASLSASHKIRLFKGKYLLRRVARRYLPARIAWRRKHGFIVDWEGWVRARDNELLRGLFAPGGLGSWGVFDPEALSGAYDGLLRGSAGVDAGLMFRIAMLGLWLESARGGVSAP